VKIMAFAIKKTKTTIYVDEAVLMEAKKIGLNVSSFTEWSLIQALQKLSENKVVVGPPGFEPESIEPKSTSLDQASRRPQTLVQQYFLCIHKNLVNPKTKGFALF